MLSSPHEDKYRKLIEKYDISDSAKIVPKNNPQKFWESTLYYNEVYIKFLRDIKKNRGAEKEAVAKAADLPKFYPKFNESIIEEMQGFCDSILIDMGITNLNMNCSLYIVYSDDVNSFSVLTEDGFAICMTTSLLQRKGMKYEILLGYVAHEFVHGALQHQLRSLYAGAKERRKNELTAGIAAGLQAVSVGANAYVAALNGQYGANYSNDYLNNYLFTKYLDESVKSSTSKYIFDYTQEQEYEADLIAYRFLENLLGSGDDYIDGLRIISSVYDHNATDTEAVSSTSSRINFLKFVKDNPDLGNKVNNSLLKARTKVIYPDVQF